MAENVVVIGGGPGGYVAAIRAADLGASVVLVEKENLGGTCLNWGCIPSKIMKNSADLLLKTRKAGPLGIKITGDIQFDMAALMERKNKIIRSQRGGIDALLKKRGIQLEEGHGMIKAPGKIQVEKNDSSLVDLDYDRLIIASGTCPLNVPDFPFDHSHILSSNDILEIKSIPEEIMIIGGGVIGCEFAFIFSALGSKVTVIEAMSRVLPLPSVDHDCSKLLQREMKKNKIKVLTDTVVTMAHVTENRVDVTLEDSPFTDNDAPKKAGQRQMSTEKMAVCIGRTPLSSALGLDSIPVETDEKGWIRVDEFMETSAPGVYAIGDILGPSKVMLAHVASHEGIVAAENAMGIKTKMHYDVIPNAIFTMPEIGTVGLSEAEARKKGLDIDTHTVNFRTLGKAQAIDEIAGEAKMIVARQDGRILGVHMTGPHATDLVAEAALAVKNQLTASDVAYTIHAHPTLAEIMGEVALKAVGSAIHG